MLLKREASRNRPEISGPALINALCLAPRVFSLHLGARSRARKHD